MQAVDCRRDGKHLGPPCTVAKAKRRLNGESCAMRSRSLLFGGIALAAAMILSAGGSVSAAEVFRISPGKSPE